MWEVKSGELTVWNMDSASASENLSDLEVWAARKVERVYI